VPGHGWGYGALVLIYATAHFDLLTGATGTAKTVLVAIVWGLTALGVVYALGLRTSQPQTYARIGRQ
jgi:hypothetical protein